MKFSESWLRSWVNPKEQTAELAKLLTMSGLEVESLVPCASPFERVVVGEVLSLEKHPQADRLNCLTVAVDAGQILPIVCGAPNVTVGMKAPCALVGAVLPGGMEIKAAKVRGIDSQGMMCSARELGLAEDSAGLLELDPEAPVGVSVRDWLELDDQQFTLKLTPNRADCLSVRGIAREVAALTGSPLMTPVFDLAKVVTGMFQPKIQLDAAAACPRYCGRSLRLDSPLKATPMWMVRRLERAGLRAKSLVVDVTNFVMLELGQPLHAFDATCLTGNITVRWATDHESLTVLSGQSVELRTDILVIADDSGPQALAGLMGGMQSAVTAESTEIFLEAAYFSPQALAGRARRLGLTSDAAFRFERGVDFAATREALERATSLLLELAGGVSGPVEEVVLASMLPSRSAVEVRPERVRRLLGFDLSPQTIEEILRRLDCQPRWQGQVWSVTAPSYRIDLEQEADYIEEVARCHGYDRVPSLLPVMPLAPLPTAERVRSKSSLFQQLHDLGFQEVVTYSFVSQEAEQNLARQPSTLQLLNPLSSALSVMRSTLAVGLVETLGFNLKRKQERVQIFEWGRCFHSGHTAGLPYEQPLLLGGLIYGSRYPEQWGLPTEHADFYDLKGKVETLLPTAAEFSPFNHPALHPGRSAEVFLQGKSVGWLGELHPRMGAFYDLPRMPLLFELELEPLLDMPWPEYRPTPRFQPVRRDVALVVDEALHASEVLRVLREAAGNSVTDISLFDVYQGVGIPSGKRSLAFCVQVQDTEKPSTEAELETICRVLVQAAEARLGAALR
ncbi:MAG: phenylalanine--tRNA ligase subunit beta [Ferrovum sp.]|nr:phenylalanine--tRNA ligase subunit beta [Ferrovum sp.]NDU87618.1 phenylalanine--tRNA ligase subunit beta [Ferrovum sp.]